MGPLGHAVVRYLAVIGIGLFLHTATARAAQILLNPGFETGALAPWFQDRDFSGLGIDWSTTSTDAHTGTFSAAEIGNVELRQNFLPLPTSSILELSFWIRHTEFGVSDQAVSFFYADTSSEEVSVATTTNGWEFFDVASDLDPGKALIGFSILGNRFGITFFDDAQIVAAAVLEPGALVLFGTGLMGLLALGWRRRRGTQPA